MQKLDILADGTIVHDAGVAAGRRPAFDPRPLVETGRNWTRWAGPAISAAVLCAVLWQLRGVDLRHVLSLVPLSIAFWFAFALHYLGGPIAEWIIFRRLWKIPTSGFVALLRKLISNEILLGYLGEVYFYAWARRRAHIATAPFGAIKDVTILSAVVGNVTTLVMLALAFPLFGTLDLGRHASAVYWSIGFVLATSLIVMLFRRRLFSLPTRDLIFIFNLHLLRLVGKTALAAWMWHLVLPEVAIGWWLLLATVRLLLSRLPFLPNKDLVFAGLAVFFVGRDAEIGDLMTMMASLILATHLLLGAALGLSDLLRTRETP